MRLNNLKIAVLISLFLAVLILAQGCATKGGECNDSTSYTVDNGVLLLDKEGTIPCDLCEERGISDKIIVLESKYCGACQKALPIIKEVEKELGANILFLDLSDKADALTMKGYQVMPHYTPTMLVGCDVYIGVKSKEEYQQIISKFIG